MLFKALKSSAPDHIEIATDSAPIRIRLRTNPRARRYSLSVPAGKSGPVLTIPANGNVSRAEKFARQHISWLVARLDQRSGAVEFLPDEIVPLRGEDHRIVASGGVRGLVSALEIEGGLPELHVPGGSEHVPRKLTDWLKSQARADLTEAATRHAAKIDRKISAISIRDTRSRWGSCSSTGRLSFSWRLILAPAEILDYVAAHEVAHLREMNHSGRFWSLCTELAPQTPEARAWLKQNGTDLHRYG